MKTNYIPSQKLWFGNVSGVHEQEARERYWILRRELETNIHDLVSKIEVKEFKIKMQEESVDNYISNRKKNYQRSRLQI